MSKSYPKNSPIDTGDYHEMTLKQAKELWDSPRSRQVITLGSGKVGVCEVGDSQGFPVVWFTGNMGSAFTILLYENIARRHRIRIFCVDRPGYNDTEDCYSKGVPNVFEFVELINELTVFLGLYQFGLVTFSLGAVFGLAFSIRYPERLKGPIHLISPWVSTSTPGASTLMNRIAKFAPSFIIRTTLTALPSVNQFLGNAWGAFVSFGSFGGGNGNGNNNSKTKLIEDEETIIIYDSPAFTISPGRSYLHNQVYNNGIWNLQNGKSGPHNDWMIALERVNWGYKYEDTTYPVRVFIGDMDEEVPIAAWEYMSKRMKNVEFKVINGAKHYLLYRMDFMEDLFEIIRKSFSDDL
ncbi:hypothetical protein G9A89_018556 [Geosiphon pyriformis]|nr:hypothetical protein G9A89_018556 [Geosiphon pyriformis]